MSLSLNSVESCRHSNYLGCLDIFRASNKLICTQVSLNKATLKLLVLKYTYVCMYVYFQIQYPNRYYKHPQGGGD